MHDRELLTRQEMVHGTGTLPGHAPDVLVTNYSMLEYMLMRPFERPIFAETRRWLTEDGAQLLLVLDEAHMYRGAKGAEVAFLIRRLRARLGIHDRPDKLRVIATSASLGGSAEARQTVRRFIADLSGKRPDDFEAITGTREVPEPAAPGTTEEADLLASLDLDAINEALDGPTLRACLAPLLPHTPADPPTDEAHVLAELHAALAGKTYVNQLVKEAAGAAQALGTLAERVFPGHPRSRRALEALLTVGTLARLRPDDPGLVPTRVHGIFRGLHGLHACINPTCHGRQADEGQKALLGKLFSTPRPSCDACGARVFEIASCRSCGSPYLLTYAEIGRLDRLSFLWGETEGALLRIELLPGQPRYRERTEELRIHLHTGYVDVDHSFPDDEVRSLHLWQDGDGRREPSFGRCAMCQPAAPARARIYDFRTRGEQPFTALIEAQFAEQPPQKRDPLLPNSGRKVLVFSDGRQKAARLAPALEHSHARDLFRQVAAIAAQKLQEGPGLTGLVWLYPAIVWVCADQRYNLFPFPDHTADTEDQDTRAVIEFRNQISRVTGKTLEQTLQMANRSRVKPVSVYGKAIFQELTDRYYSLQSLALATVEEDPAIAYIFDNFPDVGLDGDATRVLFRAWVRQHLERRSFLPEGAGMTELGEGWAKPEGIDAAKPRHIFPNRFDEYILHVLGGDQTAAQQVLDWFQALVRTAGLLHFENDLYYLQLDGLSLNLRLDSSWLRCTDCGRIHPEVLADACPACLGMVVDADADYLDARTGFYRRQVLRAFDPRTLEPFGLAAAEHSAQLTGQPDESAFNKVEEYELRFQDIPIEGKSPIDVLSCTTTMEVGIDIGALSGVALRNVPPHVANYQQRAGRAGRRGRSIASVITYAHGTSHDAHYFDHPEQIISGEVRPPIVYIENQQVLERHIHAYLVQRFFHDRVAQDATSFALFSSLGTVEQFLSDAHACSLRKLEAWLDEHATALRAELAGWVPAYSHGLQAPIKEVERTIADAIARTRQRICEVLPIADYARREQLVGLEREALERRLEDELLEALIGHAVFPRYAFPTDVVTFWVSKPRGYGEAPGKRAFDYEPQRDLQLALTEYAPGRSLTIDKWRFQSAALFSPYQPTPAAIIERRQPYTACNDCTWVSMADSAASVPQCPVCGSERLTRCAFITPAGFAPDLNEPRQVDRGQPITYAGMTDRARLELQDPPGAWAAERYDGRLLSWTGPRKLAIVNKGIDERGFRVCPDCGRSEPEFGPKYPATKLTNKAGTPTQHKHPMEKGLICSGAAAGPFFLGHRFPTDALLLRLRVDSPLRLGTAATTGLLSKASRMALTSAVEAIALAASRVLQIDEGELSGWWTPLLGGQTDVAQLYLYDLLPGGAGYARAVGDAIEQVLDAAEVMLAGCNCVTSCYRCIRHYGNNWIHASLDRHLALALIQHIRTGRVPTLDDGAKSSALQGLCEILRLRKHACEVDANIGGVHVPLLIKGPAGTQWFDVHHPLVDPHAISSPLAVAARARAIVFASVDAFDLLHDLPAAVEQVLA
jgi:rRNA maturation endonuclease Nob1